MTSSSSQRYQQMAVRHEARARNYRRQAHLMLERDSDSDCAAALLYESAKQCINAIANQLGENPGATRGKVNLLRKVAASETDGASLMENWQHADKLHIHADRDHRWVRGCTVRHLLHIHADRDRLSAGEFNRSWQQAQAFISAMLIICSRNL